MMWSTMNRSTRRGEVYMTRLHPATERPQIGDRKTGGVERTVELTVESTSASDALGGLGALAAPIQVDHEVNQTNLSPLAPGLLPNLRKGDCDENGCRHLP